MGHYALLAHVKATKLFRDKYLLNGRKVIGIALNSDYAYPLDETSEDDKKAAERYLEFMLGWFVDPLVFGKYPDSMVEYVGERLPEFTYDEKMLFLDYPVDFLGINHYTSLYASNGTTGRIICVF